MTFLSSVLLDTKPVWQRTHKVHLNVYKYTRATVVTVGTIWNCPFQKRVQTRYSFSTCQRMKRIDCFTTQGCQKKGASSLTVNHWLSRSSLAVILWAGSTFISCFRTFFAANKGEKNIKILLLLTSVKATHQLDMVTQAGLPSYLRGWDRRVVRVHKFETSQNIGTAQRETPPNTANKNKIKQA